MKAAAFRRILRENHGGNASRWWYGAASGILAVLLLCIVGLMGELWVSHGDLTVSRADADIAKAWAGEPDRETRSAAEYHDRGLIAWVWQARDGRFAAWARELYRRWPPLQTNSGGLMSLAAAGMTVGALLVLVRFFHARAARRAAQDTVKRLRSELRRQALLVEAGELHPAREAGLVELFTYHAEAVRRGLVAWWTSVPGDLLWLACLGGMALALHFWVALAAILLAAIGWLLWATLEPRSQERQALSADRAGQQMSTLVEALGQTRLLSGHLLEDIPGQPFNELLEQHHQTAVRQSAGAVHSPLPWLFTVLAIGLVAWLLGKNVLDTLASLSAVEALLLALVLGSATGPLSRLVRLPRGVGSAEASAQALFGYLDRAAAVGQAHDAAPLGPVTRQVEFERVTLLDESGQKLLDDVSFSLPAGSQAAIVSAEAGTPLGLACLLPRFRDPTQGRVLFDRNDIRHATISSLRSQSAVLLRDCFVFPGTVSDNLRCGDDRFTMLQLSEAAKLAHADGLIQALPQGYETLIGDHGPRLSPDEALQIGLARVLLRGPTVVVYEEPAEGMPAERAAALDAAVTVLAKNRTLLVLPGRIDTLRNIERVLLFQQGKLLAQGTHAELLQASELYRHLVYLRFNEFRGSGAA